MQKNKWYLTTSSIAFTVLAIAHLYIITLPLPAAFVGLAEVPLWFNGAMVIIAGYLATRGFMAAHRL